MYPSCIIGVFLGLVLGVWTQVPDPFPTLSRPPCDSPEIEEAALVAQAYLNAQHAHGYKYALNRIEEIKVISRPGEDTYFLEVELLETDCHVLDPTPVANCTVRPKVLTAIEGDCDVVLKKFQGVLAVTAFKCKTEESTEDLCLGCPTLLPLNDTSALDFVHASLSTFNNVTGDDASFTLLEVGRLSSQLVSGGPIYLAEYVIVKANCTDEDCVPLTDATAQRGLCQARGLTFGHTVDCHMFVSLATPVDANSTAPLTGPVLHPVVHVHRGNLTRHGLRHHQLTATHNPQLLSSESSESQEEVPVFSAGPAHAVPAAVAPTPVIRAADALAAVTPAAQPDAPVHVAHETSPAEGGAVPDADADVWSMELPKLDLKKREAPNAEAATGVTPAVGVPAVQLCPGRIRFF